MNASHLLSVSVTPVVLISASGLVILALYNRLGIIFARIRSFHQKKIDLLGELKNEEHHEIERMMSMIDSQIAKVTNKARAIQNGLYCLLFAVLAFLFCSLSIELAALHESIGVIAIVAHVVGILLFILGVAFAIWELTLSLSPLEEENAYLNEIIKNELSRSTGSKLHGSTAQMFGKAS